MLLHFDNLGALGVITDADEYNLPPNAWSSSKNVRFTDNAVKKFTGETHVYGTAGAAPIHAMPMQVQSDYWWNYNTISDQWHTDGTNHYNVSAATASSSGSLDYNWTGGALGGSVYVLNNGLSHPLEWTGNSITDQWANLSNWPASMIARVLRPFKNFLVAADIDEGSGRDGTLLRWSHPALPGTVPSSWDYSNPAIDAGRVQLAITPDPIVEMEPLKDINVVYKENGVWAMQYVGGNSIFAFRQVFKEFGALSRRCVKEVNGSHIVLTGENLLLHDLNQVTEILTRRWRRWLANNIDGTNYERSFVALNMARGEVWICIPQTGYAFPNIALVWSWRDNTVYLRDLPTETPHIEYGIVTTAEVQTFDGQSGTFDAYLGVYDEQLFSGAYKYPLIIDHATPRFLRGDTGETFADVPMDSYVQRDELPIGRFPEKPEPDIVKTVLEIQPLIEGTEGGIVNVYLLTRDHRGATQSIHGPYPFVIGTTRKIDCRVSGRSIGIKFESTTDITWELFSYALDVQFGGLR